MKASVNYAIIAWVVLALSAASCSKYLEEKPNQSTTVPSTLADLQAILDNTTGMNIKDSRLINVVDDNYYVNTSDWQSLASLAGVNADDARNYIWDKNATSLTGWQQTYTFPVYYSNFVLDALPDISYPAGSAATASAIRGMALFCRSFAFVTLAQLYCLPYATANLNEPGIPLRLTAAVDKPVSRATVAATYEQIINDLTEAARLVPETVPFASRPNKAAVFGLLARVYLTMRDYEHAGRFADSCLKRVNTLIDFNLLSTTATAPIARFNAETVFYNAFVGSSLTFNPRGKVDSVLYASYNDNDLRKRIFFSANAGNSFSFKGSYDGTTSRDAPFNGIAVDEMYLIRAEAHARAGRTDAAMADLNTLMIKRWASNRFTPFTASSAAEALEKVLTERRKELVFRGLRWSDLRRFNLEGANITLRRVINNVSYTLPPGDARWVLLFPVEVISFSGMPQNPR
ncbi:RagB/SusD family nutrient uptake outer membrane protein [Filimonas effusa]|nr:RagB/SusD family nutrient uptake outer membrane protein [Filimonas effusa]